MALIVTQVILASQRSQILSFLIITFPGAKPEPMYDFEKINDVIGLLSGVCREPKKILWL